MDALAGFPALTDVRLTGNPVVPQAEADARYEVRLPSPHPETECKWPSR